MCRRCFGVTRWRHSDNLPPYFFSVRVNPCYLVLVSRDEPRQWVAHYDQFAVGRQPCRDVIRSVRVEISQPDSTHECLVLDLMLSHWWRHWMSRSNGEQRLPRGRCSLRHGAVKHLIDMTIIMPEITSLLLGHTMCECCKNDRHSKSVVKDKLTISQPQTPQQIVTKLSLKSAVIRSWYNTVAYCFVVAVVVGNLATVWGRSNVCLGLLVLH